MILLHTSSFFSILLIVRFHVFPTLHTCILLRTLSHCHFLQVVLCFSLLAYLNTLAYFCLLLNSFGTNFILCLVSQVTQGLAPPKPSGYRYQYQPYHPDHFLHLFCLPPSSSCPPRFSQNKWWWPPPALFSFWIDNIR